MIVGLVVSIIAYFVAAHYIRRYLDAMEIPRGMVRGVSVFVLAATMSYGAAWLVGLIM